MKSQRGSVAIIALVFLLFLAIAGASWLPMLDTEAKHAKMDSDEQMAWYAAEAGYKRAVANLRNNASGGNQMVWGISDKSDPKKIDTWQSLDKDSKFKYAVYISNLDKTDSQSYKVLNGEHSIVAVGLVNGVRKVITGQETTASGGGGGGTFSKVNFIEQLYYAESPTSDPSITSVVTYFKKKPNSTLISFGGNFAKYLGSGFWNSVVTMILAGNYDEVELLEEVANRKGAPFTIQVGTHFYDVTPEHYLWSVTNKDNTNTLQWAYLGSALDNIMSYTQTIASSSNPHSNLKDTRIVETDAQGYDKKPEIYYVTINPDKYQNGFKWTEEYVGNPIASLIKKIPNNNQIRLPGVHKFEASSVQGIGLKALDTEKVSIIYETQGKYRNWDFFAGIKLNQVINTDSYVKNDYPYNIEKDNKSTIDMELVREMLGALETVKALKKDGWDDVKMLAYLNFVAGQALNPNGEKENNEKTAKLYGTARVEPSEITPDNAAGYAQDFIDAINYSGKNITGNLDSGNLTAATVSAVWDAMDTLCLMGELTPPASTDSFGFTVVKSKNMVYVYTKLADANNNQRISIYGFKYQGSAGAWKLTGEQMVSCTALVETKTNATPNYLGINTNDISKQ